MDPLLGQLLGQRFELSARIGDGAFGAVYRAVQHPVGRAVAVKVLHPVHTGSPELAARFLDEATSIARLRCQHTIGLYDYGRADNGSLYIAMELARGASLSQLIAESPMPAFRAARIAGQICDSLAEAHRLGIVHRDLKPDNIIVERRDGEDFVKVLDFGIAKVFLGEQAARTSNGLVTGTPAYMSPEQAQGRPLDGRSDLYAVGVLLFEMLTGRPLFDVSSPVEALVAHSMDTPPDLTAIRPDLPPSLVKLAKGLLAKDPVARPGPAEHVRDHLLRLSTEHTHTRVVDPETLPAGIAAELRDRPTEPGARAARGRRSGGWLLVAAAGLGIAIGAGALYQWAQGDRRPLALLVQPAPEPVRDHWVHHTPVPSVPPVERTTPPPRRGPAGPASIGRRAPQLRATLSPEAGLRIGIEGVAPRRALWSSRAARVDLLASLEDRGRALKALAAALPAERPLLALAMEPRKATADILGAGDTTRVERWTVEGESVTGPELVELPDGERRTPLGFALPALIGRPLSRMLADAVAVMPLPGGTVTRVSLARRGPQSRRIWRVELAAGWGVGSADYALSGRRLKVRP